jgi:putative NIF3 family GTP cyclohydrolase 1 type 2
MMTTANLERTIRDLFGSSTLDEYPNEWGFTVVGREPIRRLGYATNLTPETVDEAIGSGVDFLLTHHKAWDFLYGMAEICTARLREAGIGHLFAHAVLDAADFGQVEALLARLGIPVVEKANLYEGLWAGRVGLCDPPIRLEELVRRMETLLEEPVRVWRNHDRLIRRVGCTTGGGSMTSDVKDSVDRGCDVYITGEKMLYTVLYAHFAGIDLIVGGHTFTEIFGVESLALKIEERFPELEIVRLREEHLE